MAKARLYAITSKTLKNEPKGQAARVLEELRANTEPRLATDIDMSIATSDSPHKTRQDSLRVTLYYLLVFKKQGIVAASEQPDEAADATVVDAVGDEAVEEVDETEDELDEVDA